MRQKIKSFGNGLVRLSVQKEPLIHAAVGSLICETRSAPISSSSATVQEQQIHSLTATGELGLVKHNEHRPNLRHRSPRSW